MYIGRDCPLALGLGTYYTVQYTEYASPLGGVAGQSTVDLGSGRGPPVEACMCCRHGGVRIADWNIVGCTVHINEGA